MIKAVICPVKLREHAAAAQCIICMLLKKISKIKIKRLSYQSQCGVSFMAHCVTSGVQCSF